MARDEQALAAAVEKAAAVLIAAGFQRMPARVLMTLLVADEGGLEAAEIGRRLGVSAAAVSGGVRYLEQIGIVHRLPKPGSRRDLWEIFDNAWYTALATESNVYGAFAVVADQALAALDEPDSAGARRTAEMAEFFRYFQSRLPELMADWEAHRRARWPDA